MLTDSPARQRAGLQGKALWLAAGGLLAGAAAATLGYALLVEPLQITLERRTIRLAMARGRLPARGLRILQVSDSHFMGRDWRERQKIERVAALVKEVECDLLVHTGDFLHYDSGLANVQALLDVLPTPRLGSFGVYGNHDYIHYNMGEALPRMWRTFQAEDAQRHARAGLFRRGWLAATRWPRYIGYVRNTPLDGRPVGQNDTGQLAEALHGHDMRLLHNEALHLDRPDEGLDIYLAGVDDVTQGRPQLGHTLDSIPADAPIILLSHNPDIIGSPRIGQVDLVLSGHTHGGQLVLPFWGPAHTQSEHLSRKHVAGYFQHGRTHFYISRGMGEGIPLRFFAPPQIALLTIVGE